MQDTDTRSNDGPRPAALFRAALADAAAKERGGRTRRPDRIQAIAGLSDGDLARLAQEFEQLLRVSTDVGAIAASLNATLRALAPGASEGEVRDA
jgi:hypothetical protein